MENAQFITFNDYVGEMTMCYRRTNMPSVQITCSADVVKFARPLFNDCMDDHEELKFIHCDNASQVVNVHNAGTGTDLGVLCDIRDVIKQAIMIKTRAVVMIHNHPSGNKKPSKADVDLSLKLKDAFSLFDIRLLDSVILTKNSYYSLADEGGL